MHKVKRSSTPGGDDGQDPLKPYNLSNSCQNDTGDNNQIARYKLYLD